RWTRVPAAARRALRLRCSESARSASRRDRVQETAGRSVDTGCAGAPRHEDLEMTVGAIVLCGGRSTRMGSPKALLPFGGETMRQRVVRLLGTVVAPVVVVAADHQPLPELPADVIVARDEQEARGPLEGLRAGLKALPVSVDAAYVTSCDVPLLVPD